MCAGTLTHTVAAAMHHCLVTHLFPERLQGLVESTPAAAAATETEGSSEHSVGSADCLAAPAEPDCGKLGGKEARGWIVLASVCG